MSWPGRGWQRRWRAFAIQTDWRTGSDLYVIFSGTAPNGGASLKVLVNPVVDLLWLGGLLIGLGALIAIWPDPHVARRLARRYAEEPLPSELETSPGTPRGAA